jgi:hypothetical protein
MNIRLPLYLMNKRSFSSIIFKYSSFYAYTALICFGFVLHENAYGRDVDYNNEEVSVFVAAGEPTQVQFPGNISGGFKRKQSAVSLDRKGTDLIVFAQENLDDSGEAIIVRLDDGRSFSLRIKKASSGNMRDTVVKINDLNSSVVTGQADEEEELPYKEKKFDYAPPNQVSGFMREMMLVSEFGKSNIMGYRVSNTYKGETVLNDGTLHATIEKIYIGPKLWGYVMNVENLIDQTQRLNPATFRLDGTRAVSAKEWELAPRPMNVEQEVAGKHKTRIYVITRAK